MSVKRFYKSRRNQFIIFVIIICILYYELIGFEFAKHEDLDLTKRFIETKLEEALKHDKGSGCEIPKLDPFSPEITQFEKPYSPIVCTRTTSDGDWVRCQLSECRVREDILARNQQVRCYYRDIVHESDKSYRVEGERLVVGAEPYRLRRSDHARVLCYSFNNGKRNESWSGHVIGFRAMPPPEPPAGRGGTLNVLVLGFDSTARNGFMRRMPHSYKVLTEELNATVMNGYNVLGDGTPAALFPMLTGKNELELPEARKAIHGSGYMDQMPFIFYKLKADGYRTAYFEDSPDIGTFQFRFNGFLKQPADHYLRSFYLDMSDKSFLKLMKVNRKWCVGDRPRYKLMLDITDQFFQQIGKKFCFTFIADITHDDFNMITVADKDTATFLREFKAKGHLEDTLLVVMGDHGPRFSNVRETYQGKLEERLPLMAIVLPERLKRARPGAEQALKENAAALTTAHDLHATLLDVMDMRHYWNPYKVNGADLTRGMTLLEPIPRNRSCSEAGIESHWCACLRWSPLPEGDPFIKLVANALLKHINDITEEERSQCVKRTLTSIDYVMKEIINKEVIDFFHNKDKDGYLPMFREKSTFNKYSDNYQVKITVGPRRGVYEALVTHIRQQNTFVVNTRDISRINAYGNEPICVQDVKPHLNKYCLCKQFVN